MPHWTVSLPDGTKEDHLITLPCLHIEGLWYGSLYIELTNTSYTRSSSGWLSTINYQGTPPFVLVRAFEQAASRGVEHYKHRSEDRSSVHGCDRSKGGGPYVTDGGARRVGGLCFVVQGGKRYLRERF